MPLRIEYSEEKNLLLKATRGVDFEDVLESIRKGGLLDDLQHKNQKKHPDQKILVVKINEYVYVVPYILDRTRSVFFLKTVYPSRVLTGKYLKKGVINEKKKE